MPFEVMIIDTPDRYCSNNNIQDIFIEIRH